MELTLRTKDFRVKYNTKIIRLKVIISTNINYQGEPTHKIKAFKLKMMLTANKLALSKDLTRCNSRNKMMSLIIQ